MSTENKNYIKEKITRVLREQSLTFADIIERSEIPADLAWPVLKEMQERSGVSRREHVGMFEKAGALWFCIARNRAAVRKVIVPTGAIVPDPNREPSDYILEGNSCWIVVGGIVLYIVKSLSEDGVSVEFYEQGREEGETLDSLFVAQPVETNLSGESFTVPPKVVFGEELVSNCCGAADSFSVASGVDCSPSDIGICPQCKEHCEFVAPEAEEEVEVVK